MSKESAILFGEQKVNSSRNIFEAVKICREVYNNLLGFTRATIKHDYGDNYIENIECGDFGVSRFLTVATMLGFATNTVGQSIDLVTNGEKTGESFYLFGCPDFQRKDKKFNLYLRSRYVVEVEDFNIMRQLLHILVKDFSLKFCGYFPLVEYVTEDNKVKVKDRNDPICSLQQCPIYGVKYMSIYGINDECFLRDGDSDIKAALNGDGIKLDALGKNKALDKHVEELFCKMIKKAYGNENIMEVDPFGVFSRDKNSIFYTMRNAPSESAIIA